MIDRCGNAPSGRRQLRRRRRGRGGAGRSRRRAEPTEGCPAFVPSTKPVPPTSAGERNATGLPQGPQTQAAPSGASARHADHPGPPARNRAADRPRGVTAERRKSRKRVCPLVSGDLAMSGGDAAAALARLDEITRRLRVECPWDREQDERSIVPHTVEEAYELADAAAAGRRREADRRARRRALPGPLPRAAPGGARRRRPRPRSPRA